MNRHCFLVAAFIVSLSAVVFAQSQTQRFQVAGVTRTYIVYAPTGLNNPPLVFNIHGYNMTATLEQSICKMDKIADREKFIVVYPNAIDKSWDMSGANDFTFLLAIIDTMDAKYHIDRNRIYATGFSQGGFMDFQLACKYADIFAAIAPTSGLLSGTCKLKRPVPMFLTFGTDDVATPAQFMASVNSWLKLDSCPSTPVVTRPYPSTNAQSVVTRLYYGPCAQGSEVVVDSVFGGPHEWPMNTTTKVNNSEEVWAFFKKFSLKGASAITRQTFSVTHDAVSASYSSGIVRLKGVGENFRVRVVDTKGRLAAIATVAQRQITFKDKPSGVYVVMASENDRPVAIRMVIP